MRTDTPPSLHAHSGHGGLGHLGRGSEPFCVGLADHRTRGFDATYRMLSDSRRTHERQPDAHNIPTRFDAAVQRLPYTRPHAPRRNALLVLVYALCLLLLAGVVRDLLATGVVP